VTSTKIFGVASTKRWQGFAVMETKAISEDVDDKFSSPFKIKWIKRYGYNDAVL
jgi:hypothetical protein